VVMEAELEASMRREPYEARHPAEVLLTAVLASDVLLRHLLDKHASGELTADESMALGWAIDRAARLRRRRWMRPLTHSLLESRRSGPLSG
jgi:hypothetical protein